MAFSKLIMLPIVTFMLLVGSILVFSFDFAWYFIFPIVGFIFLVTSWLIPFIYIKRVPKAARTLIEAAAKKLVPALIVHDSGRAAIHLLLERRGEGVVMTDQGEYRLLPRYAEMDVTDLPEETTQQGKKKGNPTGEEVEQQKKKTLREKLKLDWNIEWITKRSILVGLGLPFYVAYSGKLCLLNPECLAWYEAGEIFVPTEDNPVPTGDDKKKPMPLMFLSVQKMKAIINKRYDMSQLNAILVDAENLGRLGRGLTTGMKVGIVLALVAVAILIIFLAPSLTG